MDCAPSGEVLPASQNDIDIGRAYLQTAADAASHFGGDQARAGAEKRVIDQLGRPAVVDDRATHALDRLLRAMPPALLALWIAKWVVVGDLPHGGLLAVTLPVARLALTHRVPAVFMTPMVMAAAQRKMLLDPDDLRPRLQPASRQIGADHVAVEGSVPNISDISGKQRIGLPPVAAIIVEHLALREVAGPDPTTRAPARIIVDPVRRVGDHQVRHRSSQHRLDIGRAGAVATTDPVVSKQPDVARPSDWVIGYFREAVGIGQTARSETGQDLFKLMGLEADQIEVETTELEILQLSAQQIGGQRPRDANSLSARR